jgi:hypothetical protein
MKFKLSIFGLGFLLLFSIPLLSQYAPFYVLDGYGGVHAGGGAPAITPGTPYWGWDIAKSIDYVPIAYSSSIYGDGYLVLDGYGGVWQGGKLASISVTPKTPYWGFNVARSLVYRVVDPEAYGYSLDTTYQLLDNSMNTVASFYLNLPDAGWVFVEASAMLWNTSTTLSSATRYGIGVDTNTVYDTATHRWASFNAGLDDNNFLGHQAASTAKLFYLDAGQHYFYFLAERVGGTATVDVTNRTMTAIYINKTYTQSSLDARKDAAPKYSDQPSNLGKK